MQEDSVMFSIKDVARCIDKRTKEVKEDFFGLLFCLVSAATTGCKFAGELIISLKIDYSPAEGVKELISKKCSRSEAGVLYQLLNASLIFLHSILEIISKFKGIAHDLRKNTIIPVSGYDELSGTAGSSKIM